MLNNLEVTKGRDGWEAVTTVDIGIAPPDSMNKEEGKRILTFTTSKDTRGNIETRAVVFIHRHHSRQHAFGLGGGGDFSKKVCAQVGMKCTEKAVRKAHDDAAQLFPTIEQEARAWYDNSKHKI